MRKFTRVLCMLLAMIFVLSACGGESKKTEPNPDAGLTLDATELSLKVGESKELKATFVPANEGDDTTITLTSSDDKIVKVEGMKVTAVAAGTATVTAKNSDGAYTVTCKITVTAAQQIIAVMYEGETIKEDITSDPHKTVEANFGVSLSSGKNIMVQLPEGQQYLGITIGKGVKEAIVYVPGGTYTYTVPSDLSAIYPSGFGSQAKVSVRIPSQEELTTKHNLALNPYDTTDNKKITAYPHVQCNNQYNLNEFAARCAIDGFTTNTSHGRYPQQSWGPNEIVRKTDFFLVNFNRTVTVDEIVVFLRGDFGHDAYYSAIVLEFSDGSTETINPKKIRDGQKFTFEARETTSVKLTGFEIDKTGASASWTGLAEVEIYGTEKLG